jgi:hypothetical protein
MKKETIEEGKQILNRQEKVGDILLKLEEGSITDEYKKYLFNVQISVRKEGEHTQETNIGFNPEGNYDGSLPLSDKHKEILTYLTKQYHQAVVRLFKVELEELQNKFDNLKD